MLFSDVIKIRLEAISAAIAQIQGGPSPRIEDINVSLAAVTGDVENAAAMQNSGADRIVYVNYSNDEKEREEYLESARALSRKIDIPFFSGTWVNRFEDVKKAFYTGSDAVIVQYENIENNPSILKESTDRFGKDAVYVIERKIAVSADGKKAFTIIIGSDPCEKIEENYSKEELVEDFTIRLKHIAEQIRVLSDDPDSFRLSPECVFIGAQYTGNKIMPLKHELAEAGLKVNTFAGKIDFKELKTNSDGLVPCIAQDYKTGEVLMMAYMNEEAYEKTLKTGVMTYFSRSRQSLWVKGETSGHFQYVRELKADCDNDTLLAKVVQIGAACHTGNRSCFFNEVMKHEYTNKDISAVLRDLYGVVCDRKINPKEGSYTNYLFNKGIDKILKKCGEEATEMVIAAKNPSHEELKYEIADLLYHMTVLMVECGVSWEEVATELANR
ncbi:MAG: bifunctional phosphoribosyl-AMP cyclohydrolase/phosphoribosyl-ATP diphosphatase HisIE [Lachnospiraceae bacterium]|nr:bifunctional phosphoribosyl-AMP cyclohydrolase/phosphoribosyl-ATP diphosphatase HisIE [Lachnospiraceae bacterium]